MVRYTGRSSCLPRHSLGDGGSAREARVSKDAACFDRAQHKTFDGYLQSKHPGLSLLKAHHERAFTQLISGNGIRYNVYRDRRAPDCVGALFVILAFKF